MNNYKIKVNNEAESREAQDLFEQLGFMWASDYPENGDWYSHLYAEKSSCCHLPIYVWNGLGDKFQELTLPQLRDLVVLHRKDVKDATHTDGERKGFLSSDGVEYFWNAYDLEWFKAKQMTFAYEKFKPIQEHGLISGADAKLAWAKGDELQIRETGTTKWKPLTDKYSLMVFDYDRYELRIKPRTITLNVEIPAPFEPKMGEKYYFFTSNGYGYDGSNYSNDHLDEEYLMFGAWRTEDEIKQVVAALRGGIKA